MTMIIVCVGITLSLGGCSVFTEPVYSDFNGDTVWTVTQAPNKPNTVLITWITVEDPDKTCRALGSFNGLKSVQGVIRACAFWSRENKTCTVYTGFRTTLNQLGHETRHCFEGHWHR